MKSNSDGVLHQEERVATMWNEVDSIQDKRKMQKEIQIQKKVLRADFKQVARSTACRICREKKVNTIRTANKKHCPWKGEKQLQRQRQMPKKQALERWIVSRWEKGGAVASREKERQIEAFSRTVALTWRRRWRRSKTFETVCRKTEFCCYKRKIPSEIKISFAQKTLYY